MENYVFYTLTLKEAMSAIKSNGADLSLFPASPSWKSTYAFSNNTNLIFDPAYTANYTNQSDKFYNSLPIFIWEYGHWNLKAYGEQILNYIFKEYGNSYAVNCEDDEATTLFKNSVSLLDSILNIIYVTYDKYKTILDAYANETDLLKAVISTSTNTASSTAANATSNAGFNKQKDTPQNAVTLTNLGDDYNTSVNISEGTSTNSSQAETAGVITSEDDRDTIIARIAEIEEKYSLVMDKWAREFSPLFWEA